MTTLRRYLWKEWRDNRVVVCGFAIAWPILCALTAVTWPQAFTKNPLFATLSALCALLVATLSLGADLIPGEARREKLCFLQRLPADLNSPFFAKLLVFCAATAFFPLYGYLAAGAAGALIAQGPLFPPLDQGLLVWATVACGVGIWIFPISAWLPRGALALPATLFVLALLLAPFYLIFTRGLSMPVSVTLDPRVGVPFSGSAFAPGLLLFLSGSVATAWISFARGKRWGRGPSSASWRGLIVAAVFFTPAWVYAERKVEVWAHVSPDEKGVVLCPPPFSALGSDGRFAFVTAQNGHMERSVVVDLENGAWTRLGGEFDDFASQMTPIFPPCSLPQQWIRWKDYDPARHTQETRFVDGRTGSLPSSLPGADELRDAARATAPFLLPDGRRAWIWNGRVERDSEDGTATTLWTLPKGASPQGVGLGFVLDSRKVVYDLWRGKRYPLSRSVHPFVRAGDWIVGKDMYDPDTKQRRPIPGLRAKDRVEAVSREGVAFVCAPGELVALDCDTGRRTGLLRLEKDPKCYPGVRVVGRTPAGKEVLSVESPHGISLARWESASRRLTPACGPMRGLSLLGCPDENTAIAIAGRTRIVRLHFGSDSEEVLFPR